MSQEEEPKAKRARKPNFCTAEDDALLDVSF